MLWLRELQTNIRFYVLLITLLIATAVFIWVSATSDSNLDLLPHLAQAYGFLAASYLYLTLIGSPIYKAFPRLRGKERFFRMARPLGVSAFFFALLHGFSALFGELGGFHGLLFLPQSHVLPVTFGITALTILAILASTSFDQVVERLTFPRWKKLHQLVYVAAVLVVIHVFLLGSHVVGSTGPIPFLIATLVVILLLLEAYRISLGLRDRGSQHWRLAFLMSVVVTLFGFGWWVVAGYNLRAPQFAIHMHHDSAIIEPNTDENLAFLITNTVSGQPVGKFVPILGKLAHLRIVDEQLTYSTLLYPAQDGNLLYVTTQFPHPGEYRLTLTVKPSGGTEQQFSETLFVVGESVAPTPILQQN